MNTIIPAAAPVTTTTTTTMITSMITSMNATDDNQVRAARAIRALYLELGRDLDALVFGFSEVVAGHDDDAACALEAAMFAALRRRRPALVG